jgi:UDP-N-acetylglucosamine--N-acetylmuramyl-(pentapeptide) pyrophosphoryl-undecaprenol N-acetylglucosamine transferase
LVKRRVYIAVFGSGLGHVTRMLDISARLPKEEYEFRFSSSGQGYEHLEVRGMRGQGVRCPPLDVEWAVGGGFSSHKVLPGFPFMLNNFLKQVAFERGAMHRFDPDLVVSDSRLSALIAARSRSYPVITMLNQFKILFPPRFRGRAGRLYERIAGDALGLMWSLSDSVLMTDLPPPYTIAEANLSGSEVSRIVQYVGFTAPRIRVGAERLRRAKEALGLDSRPLVFAQISGPEPTKGRFLDTLLRASPEISRRYNFVLSMGRSGGSTEPRRLGGGAWAFDWCPLKDELFELSALLVSRAGHSTIGQCIDHGKPAVLVPIHNHPEQICNAEKFARLGLGATIRSEKLTPQNLVESIDSCMNDPRYEKRMRVVSAVSSRYDGMENCARIIGSSAQPSGTH